MYTSRNKFTLNSPRLQTKYHKYCMSMSSFLASTAHKTPQSQPKTITKSESFHIFRVIFIDAVNCTDCIRRTPRKTFQCHFIHHKSHIDCSWLKADLRDEWPATRLDVWAMAQPFISLLYSLKTKLNQKFYVFREVLPFNIRGNCQWTCGNVCQTAALAVLEYHAQKDDTRAAILQLKCSPDVHYLFCF